jgi:hypothetical protein
MLATTAFSAASSSTLSGTTLVQLNIREIVLYKDFK